MEKIISLLSEIEGKAATILDHTAEEKQSLHDQLDKDIEKLDRQIQIDTNAKINELRLEFNTSIEAEKQALINASDEQIKKLENDFTNNHDTLVAKVFSSIIGV